MNIVCPVCGASYAAGPEHEGSTFNCSVCGAALFVPAETHAPEAASAPTAAAMNRAARPQRAQRAAAPEGGGVSVTLQRGGSVYGFAANVCGVLWFITELLIALVAAIKFMGLPDGQHWSVTAPTFAAYGAAMIFSTLFFAGGAALFRIADVALRISGVRPSFGL